MCLQLGVSRRHVCRVLAETAHVIFNGLSNGVDIGAIIAHSGRILEMPFVINPPPRDSRSENLRCQCFEQRRSPSELPDRPRRAQLLVILSLGKIARKIALPPRAAQGRAAPGS